MVPLPPLHERLRTAREAAGLSQPQLFRKVEGIGYETIRGVESPPSSARHRYPSPEVLAAYLRGVGVDPMTFPEYRLAVARRQLDERVVDAETALANLALVASALGVSESATQDRDELEAELEQRAEAAEESDSPGDTGAPSKRGRGRRPRAS